MANSRAPAFFLYGEPPRAAERRFLHVEDLAERSRPNAWSIRAHAHDDLHQLFLMETGAGRMQVEDRSEPFVAPCVLLVGAGAVHGFDFEPDSTGLVLTLAQAFVSDLTLRDRDFVGLFAATRSLDVSMEAEVLGGALRQVRRELGWPGLAGTAATEGALLVALAAVARARGGSDKAPSGRSLRLVERFRELVEARWREPLPLSEWASMAGVSPSRLRAACAEVVGAPPAALLQSRRMAEAKRALLYSDLRVAEIGAEVGLDDPAYFSRAFKKSVGCSPAAFRSSMRRPEPGAGPPPPRSRR